MVDAFRYAGRVEEPPIAAATPRASGPLVEHLARRMRIEAESELAALGLRPRHVIALTLLRELGDQNQADLAQTLRVDRTNVVALLNDLEAWHFVERRRAPDDRRRHKVMITASGRERLAEVERAILESESRVLTALNPGQRTALYELLQQASGSAAICSEHLPTAEWVADTTD